MSINYAVIVEDYVERHFIKKFRKKYKNAWDITWRAILEEFKRTDSLFETSIAETIAVKGSLKICKTEFRVAGTKESRRSSGNRCIVAVDVNKCVVCVLLVYHKNDLGSGNETTEWKNLIKENYPEYKSLF